MQGYNSDLNQELSHDGIVKPFIGKYHKILRNRTKTIKQEQGKQKKIYRQKVIKKRKPIYYSFFYNNLQTPIISFHIYNYHNILAINELSMRNPQNQQSFILSKFYTKKIKKASIQNNFLLLNLEDNNIQCTPISYICDRLKSFGDNKFYQLAEAIMKLQTIIPQMENKVLKCKQLDQALLQQFMRQMDNRMFISQYSPELLIISKGFIQFLGFNMEEFAIQSIKNKSILYEFFTSEHYAEVINQYLRNINLFSQYLHGQINYEELNQKSSLVYNDAIYNKHNTKLYCQFYAGASKQLKPYIEIHQINKPTQREKLSQNRQNHIEKLLELKEIHHLRQLDTLKKLTNVPRHFDPTFKQRICRYMMI